MSEPSTRGRQWTSGRSGEGGRTVVTIAPSPRTGFVTTGRRWVRSAQWFGVPVRDVVRARRGGRVRVLERVVDAVEHQENVRARERRDVVARTVHDVRVEPQGGAGWSGELIDTVAVGHVGNDLLGGHPDLLLLQGGLMVVPRGLAQARHEGPARTGHHHTSPVTAHATAP